MSLQDAFASHLATLGLEPGPVLVAVSGGPDSVALLDLLAQTRDRHGLEPIVAHADHGIHPESAAVAREVERLAASYGFPCVVGRLALGPKAGETAARRARIEWLETVRREQRANAILTAHQADDQVETVLMRFLRGSGPAGLAGIRRRQGVWVRPLLAFGREELARYVRERGLAAWDDPANRDPRHLRSWIRIALVPLLRERLPDLDQRIRGAARQAGFQRAGWDALLDHLTELDWRVERGGCSVARVPLAACERPLAVALFQAMARRVGFVLGPARAARALKFLATAESGAVLELGSGWRFEVSFDRLLLLPPLVSGVPAVLVIAQRADAGAEQWGEWTITWTVELAPAQQRRDGCTAWFIHQPLMVRPWQSGERIHPLGGPGRRLVARCFQDARVARSRRSTWPVFDAGGHAVWIPGVCRGQELVPPAGSPALRVDVARG